MYILEFEKPILALKSKIEELRMQQQTRGDEKLLKEINKLERQTKELEKTTYSTLNPWEKTLLARHPKRPYTLDFIEHCTTEFTQLHGDRNFRDDPAIIGGLCRIDGQPFMVVGHQKGRNTQDNVKRNFGMPHPEGYRKALRLMRMASRFKVPILSLIDTPGAYPGIGAEERGQSEAIAVSLREMAALETPIIAIVTGEGGSGGAIALGVANRVLMYEHSIYSVISPEGCAGILFGDGTRAQEAAQSLRYSAQDLLSFHLIDEIIPEPLGGAHVKPDEALDQLKRAALSHFNDLRGLTGPQLVEDRYQKFRKMGEFAEG